MGDAPRDGLVPRVTAAAVVLLHAVLAWIWWSHQELPRGFRDEFFIVEVATEAAFAGDLRALVFGDYYPPLLRLPGVLALWSGGGYRAMLAAQALVWLPVLALGTWWSARRFGSAWGATLAVAVLLPAAGVLDALHRFEPNLGATAAGAAALAAYLWSDGLTRRRETVLLGVALAAGLLVDRLGVAPFAAVPVLAALRRPEARRNVLVLGAVVLVLVGWWYGPFLLEYGAEWLPQLRAGELDRDGARLEERPPGVLWALHYLWILVDGQGGLLVGPVLLAGLVWGVARRREDGVGATLLWVGAGLLLFTLIPKRQPFYTLPLLPGLAALAGAMLGRGVGEAAPPHGPRSQVRLALLGAVAAALVTLPALFTARPGEDLDPGVASWALHHRSPLPERWVGERFPLGQRPDGRALDVGQLADALDGIGVAQDAPLLVLSTDGQISESQLLSVLRIERRSAAVYGVVVHPEAVVENAGRVQALVDLRGGEGWPDDAAIVGAYEQRFGWEENPALLAAMRELGERLGSAGDGTPVSDSVLRVWAR